MAGDPGFFGTLGSIFKRTARAGIGFVAGGGAPGQILRAVRGRGRRSGGFVAPQSFVTPQGRSGRGIARFGPSTGPVTVDPVTGEMRPRRRRMNVGNAKALRRAIRRTDGFVRLARGALKNTGFKIVSKSSGKVSRATLDKAVAAAHHRGK